MVCSQSLSPSVHQCRRTMMLGCSWVSPFRTIAASCFGFSQFFCPASANVAFIIAATRPTLFVLFRDACGLRPTSYLPALHGLDGGRRSYGTANSAARLEAESFNTVDQGALEAKRKEFESLRRSVEEFVKEIAKLKELQKGMLVELGCLKIEGNGVDIQSEGNLERGKTTRESLECAGKSSRSRRKKTTTETSSSSSSNFSVPVKSGSEESKKPAESRMLEITDTGVKKLTLETLGLAEEPEEADIKKKSKKYSGKGKAEERQKEERKSSKGEDVEAMPGSQSTKEESVKTKQHRRESNKSDCELLEKSKSKSDISRDQRCSGQNMNTEIETGNDASSVGEKGVLPSEEEIAQVILEDSKTDERAVGIKRPKKKLSPFSNQHIAQNGLGQVGEQSTDFGYDPSILDKVSSEVVGKFQPGLNTTKSKFDHPWLEWSAFLEHLEEKNYFAGVADMVGTEQSLIKYNTYIKNALMSFGRERDDLFRFLSKQDISVIVSFGCPGADRKAVNAAKRLRAQLGIAEGDVCQQCRLKRSCTRAFCLPDRQMASVTLDVVRLLLPFAVNVLPDAETHESYPEEVTTAIRNLLEQLVRLSSKPKKTNIRKPNVIETFSPEVSPATKGKFDEENSVGNLGDWSCPNCAYSNFSRNRQCRACGVFRPMRNPQPGDWECPNPKCRFTNFTRNIVCLECQTERGTFIGLAAGERNVCYAAKELQGDRLRWGGVDSSIQRSVAGLENEETSPLRAWTDDENERSSDSSHGLTFRRKHEEWQPNFRGKGKIEDSDFDDLDESEFSEDDNFSDEQGFGHCQKSMMGARNPKFVSSRRNCDVSDDDDAFSGNNKSVVSRDNWKQSDKTEFRSKARIGNRDHNRSSYRRFSPDFQRNAKSDFKVYKKARGQER